MPELPEVHVHAERLDAALAGSVLQRVDPLTFTAFKTLGPQPGEVEGQVLRSVTARGKYLLLRTDALTFAVHLMQGGRLKPAKLSVKRPRGGIAQWVFENEQILLLTEAGTEHKAGVWVLRGDPLTQDPLAGLGPDAHTLNVTQLDEILRAQPGRLHTMLRDQSAIAGIGRRLANEICHRAKLSPFASGRRLAKDEMTRLHAALREVLAEDLAFERGREEMSSSAERPARVHNLAGTPCSTCGDVVRSVEYRSYTVSYCATCQTDGRVLADNTTSKFLR